ncbi:MAG: XdhC family protein [Chloroflexota bacterium]|nr:MAG: XdhC family protein [Chloroflexota bacterium]
MRDVIQEVEGWLAEQAPVAVATVIETWGSAPRDVGAKMALTADGRIAGSVSGGCVEGAVAEVGSEVLLTREPQLLHFGVADETAWDVGLACGGTIDVFVEPLQPTDFNFLRDLLNQDEPFAVATVIVGPEAILGRRIIVQRGGRLFGQIGMDVDGPAAAAARAALAKTATGRQSLLLPDVHAEPIDLFVEIVRPASTLIVIGGVHIAIALTLMAKTLRYRTIVIDPRRAFGSEERFPHVDSLIQAWPDEAFAQLKITDSTAIASLTHDPKIDDPALAHALRSSAFYVGALGSQKTHAARRKRLLKFGLDEDNLDRIHGPIGLSIGARTPEEIAISIMAEIVAAQHEQ